MLYLCVLPVGDARRNLPLLLLLYSHLKKRRRKRKRQTLPSTAQCDQSMTILEHRCRTKTQRRQYCVAKVNVTFLLGECMTGAGGDGGPLGIFLLILNHTNKPIKVTACIIKLPPHTGQVKVAVPSTHLKRGGSMGSFCISTMRITLCLAPELNATPCWDGVYLRERKQMV